MALFNQVTIIGVGFMGGSVAKAIRKKRVVKKIIGFFRSKQKQKKALRSRIVDDGFFTLKESIKGSDLVILALPVHQIISFMAKLKNIVDRDVVIMDMGSTKLNITTTAQKFRLNFVGTHPLAGSEKKGANFSSENLFDTSLVIITPTQKTAPRTLKKIRSFWRQLNTKTTVLAPKLHDTILAHTSHLPHVVAFSLINAIPKQYLSFGASGLKDSTRIALSDTSLWTHILLHNRIEVLRSLTRFQQEVKKIKIAMKHKQSNRILNILSSARTKRQTIT